MVKQATPVRRSRAALEDPPVPVALIQDPALKDKVVEKAKAIAEADGFCIATVPKGGITVTMDGHVPFEYAEGTHRMPRNVAEHWFARARGVKVVAEA